MVKEIRCIICKKFNPKFRLFQVPNNTKKLQKWSVSLNGLKLKPFNTICERHFIKDHIKNCQRFNCLQLTNNAVPRIDKSLSDINKVDNKCDHDNELENEFDESINVVNLGARKKCFRNIGIQTNLEELKTCAFVTVSPNLLNYYVTCFYCDTSFSIHDCNNFMKHVQKNHRLKKENFYDCGVSVDSQMQMEVESYIEEEIKSESKNETYDFLKEENNTVNSIKPKEEVWLDQDLNFLETIDSEFEVSTMNSNCDENIEIETYKKAECEKPQKQTTSKKSNCTLGAQNAINIETSDFDVVFGFLELLRTCPQLWFYQRTSSSSEALKKFQKEFNAKYKLNLSDLDMHKSLEDISTWYRNMFENENFTKLSYPQCEYYEICCKFLPDKIDGKTCDVCNSVLPDHLQFFVHKKLKHPETLAAGEIESNSNFGGITKETIYNYLYARYPIGKLKKFQCQVCFQNCRRKTDFFDHIKAHLNIRDFVCDICGAAFVRSCGFNRHKQRHIGPSKRVCKICNKICNDNNMLGLHRRRFHRPIEGTIEEIEANCYKRAPKISQYKTRIDSKTNKMIWVCHFCDNVDYHSRDELINHLEKHHKHEWKPPKSYFNKKRMQKQMWKL